eukprot:GHVL01036671.1.p1 GENE.GHVL01036671.1~~GHVL01036671.1.p1  ORF type:complete len:791 (+),score=131.96 GHVL01036671.1:459-2831(+)
MRDAAVRLGGDASKLMPLVPVDLVVDHSVQADSSRNKESLNVNQKMEMQRNAERFSFLKWGATAFDNMLIVPPGSGIVHQVNLEYLARVVFDDKGVLYPDSVVGTDSHTTMIDGLGVVGWGVGGIEAEAVMLGQPISMVLPQVVGFELTGKMPAHSSATDLVLEVTQMLRKEGVVGKFVEFFGSGVRTLSLADRATVANMSPEYGATMGFFPVDEQSLKYLRQTGRPESKVQLIESYLRAQELFVTESSPIPSFSSKLHLDLSTVEPCVSGPKRPHDRVPLSQNKNDFLKSLTSPTGFKGYGLKENELKNGKIFTFKNKEYSLSHGSVVIAAITSCTNTSNPGVMIAAGLLARNALDRGLVIRPYVKTTLSPGSKAVTEYLKASGLLDCFEKIGFYLAGYGCMTCIGNSGDLDNEVSEAVSDLVVSAVLSGNRNFEGRVHPQTRANYLASPPLVVAYALAGKVDIDFKNEPVGMDKNGKPVFLKEIWPTKSLIDEVEDQCVKPATFKNVYTDITKGTEDWENLKVEKSELYPWDEESTYIHNPPFFQKTELKLSPIDDIKNAYCLLNVGHSITTDHISPAGNIAKDSPAARYLTARGVNRAHFNTYGARRGNDEIMARGTFANIRLINKLCPNDGPKTIHIPSEEVMPIFDAAMKYQAANQSLVILAGKEYGSGSSRDWAAKGPYLLGIRAIIAESFERIHRTNLVGMGIIPLQFKDNENADTLRLDGKERYSIPLKNGDILPGEMITVTVNGGEKSFDVKARIDTDVEASYFKHGGILHFVLRNIVNKS